MGHWLWIVLGLLVFVAGASLQVSATARGMRAPRRRTLRSRRAEMLRRRRDEAGQDAGENADDEEPDE